MEKLLEGEDEELCASLLTKRQTLLEQLASKVNETNTDVNTSEYRDFLLAIQMRDQKALSLISIHQTELLKASNYQVKTKKALSAYQKFSG